MVDYIARYTAFGDGSSHECPVCGTPVTAAKLYAKFESELFSLYVFPCNCRLGLWSKAPDWIECVTVISLEDQDRFIEEREARAKLARWNAAAKGGE